MQIEQKCEECGMIFMRSLYHPQITKCPDCKAGRSQKPCIWCKWSYKKEWMLWCPKRNKDVTHGMSCEDFIPAQFTPAQRAEIEETLEMVRGKSWN